MAKGKQERRKIAVILSDMDGEYALDTLRGIECEAHIQGMDVYIFNSSAGVDEEIKHNVGEHNIYNLIDYSGFDGVILFPNMMRGFSIYNNVVGQIRESGCVAVSIDAKIDGFTFLGGENYQPMKNIVNHLIEEHHLTKINYVSGQDYKIVSRERLKAYKDALREHGIPVEEERIFRGTFVHTHGRETALKMLETPHLMPEAVVCASDSIAMGVRNVFIRHRVRIPEQVVLTGFDDAFDARNSVPTLTTVSREKELLGREAVLSITKMLAGETVEQERRFPGKAIFRESCGCCAKVEDSAELRSRYLRIAEQYKTYSLNYNMLTEDLNSSISLEDYLERLQKHVKKMECEAFYLCLNKNLVEDLLYAATGKGDREIRDCPTKGYPETMTLVMACENKEIKEGFDFPAAQVVPKLPEDDEPMYNYIISPIHFREYCMGYTVVKNSKFVPFATPFRSWLINLSNSLESLRKQLHLQNLVAKLDRMYVTDALTGLYNRFGLDRYTEESTRDCAEKQSSFMTLFVDLDGLKQINDRFGHDDGDVAILTVSKALQKACLGEEVCARIGGDEFVVYAAGYSEEDAVAYCERLEDALAEANEKSGKPYQVEVSCGYEVVFPKVGDLLGQYIDMADCKMYINKRKKRD